MATKTAAKKTKYSVGEKVVYPMHGVGSIEKIEQRNMFGTPQLYYIIKISADEMTVMIPVDKSEELGLRPIVSNSEIEQAMTLLSELGDGMNEDWKIRFNNNREKIKTGSIFEVSEVVRNLFQRNKSKELSSSERKLYETAYQMLVEEISLKTGAPKEDVENMISERLEEGQKRAERKQKKKESRDKTKKVEAKPRK